eukprot:CAMPEP_0197614826 /NCGR_PEP_ID=MMETSP1326-20131121/59721_1 /TAXON_ID=1155430 /ORGANISM="Genus nov. species nov., Strain RCC2288" /LENGTH=382 /DNA_ID=CAMNT_0043183703 /DNA_START=919 /DNA_END=2068 /DNA_ORIENTATION=+
MDGPSATPGWPSTRNALENEIACQIARLVGAAPRGRGLMQHPALAAVVIGDRPDSLLFVRRKGEACKEAGIRFYLEHFPGNVAQEKVLHVLRRLNTDINVHGILLQLPVPPHLNESRLLECINPRKDVDGLHPYNVGRLAMRGIWRPAFMPCAPLGCMELLRRGQIRVRESSVAIIGDSNVVGMPMSWLLRDAGASSVTLLHSRGVNFLKRLSVEERGASVCAEDATTRERLLKPVRGADIIIAAFGCVEVVRGDWVKPGATVVDIGINTVSMQSDGGTDRIGEARNVSVGGVSLKSELTELLEKRNGHELVHCLPGLGSFRVVGDVAAEEVSHIAGAMTSVPGGAGPMTIAALLSNTLSGCFQRSDLRKPAHKMNTPSCFN